MLSVLLVRFVLLAVVDNDDDDGVVVLCVLGQSFLTYRRKLHPSHAVRQNMR